MKLGLRNKFLTVVIIHLSVIITTAQNTNNFDSIIVACNKIKNDSAQISCLIEQAHSCRRINPKLSKALLEYSFKLNNSPHVNARIQNDLGAILYHIGEYNLSIDNFQGALNFYKKIEDFKGIASSFNGIANVYLAIGQLENAIKYYKKSLEFLSIGNVSDSVHYSIRYYNIALCYVDLDFFDSAKFYFNRSYQIESSMQNDEGIYYALSGLGHLEFDKGNLYEAKEYYSQAYNLARSINDSLGMAEQLFAFSQTELKIGNYISADTSMNKARVIAEKIEDERLLRNIYQWLTRVSIKLADTAKISYYYEKSLSGLTRHMEKEFSTKLAEYDKRYEAQEKENRIKDLELEKQKQGHIRNTMLFISILIISISVLLFRQVKIQKKNNTLVTQQKREIENKNKDIMDSIHYAKRIQEAILPSMAAMQQALKDGFVLYKPKDLVAGDFYWMEQYCDKTYYAAADCTGHGVPGAMVSVVCSNALTKSLLEENITETGKLLDRTREIVINRLAKSGEEVKDGMDISICAIDFNAQTLQWSGANNPLWIVQKNTDGEAELLETKHDKQPIGVHHDISPFTSHNIPLVKGDTIYIFTDGFQDQFGGEKEKKFMAKRLKQLLLSIKNKTMDEQRELLDNEFEQWRGKHEQVDDVCIIGVRIGNTV